MAVTGAMDLRGLLIVGRDEISGHVRQLFVVDSQIQCTEYSIHGPIPA